MNNAELALETDRLARHRTNHVLHLILSVLTLGFWIFVWILVAMSNGIERKRSRQRIRKMSAGATVAPERLSTN